MNFFSRQPREIGQLRTDFAPPSPEGTMVDLIRKIRDMPEPKQAIACDYDRKCWDQRCLEAGHCVGGLKPESEVMPIEPRDRRSATQTADTRLLSATGADRINPLDDIASKFRSLTYGEMIELASAIWKMHDETSGTDDITAENLPAILHKWAVGHDR